MHIFINEKICKILAKKLRTTIINNFNCYLKLYLFANNFFLNSLRLFSILDLK